MKHIPNYQIQQPKENMIEFGMQIILGKIHLSLMEKKQ